MIVVAATLPSGGQCPEAGKQWDYSKNSK